MAKIAALDKKFEWAAGYDWDSLGRGCTGQLSRSADIIASDDFSKKIDNVIDAAKKKLADEYVELSCLYSLHSIECKG